MYLFKKPNDERIGEFIESQSRLEFTYPSVGTTRTGDDKGDIHWTTDDISEIESELESIEAEDSEALLTDLVGGE